MVMMVIKTRCDGDISRCVRDGMHIQCHVNVERVEHGHHLCPFRHRTNQRRTESISRKHTHRLVRSDPSPHLSNLRHKARSPMRRFIEQRNDEISCSLVDHCTCMEIETQCLHNNDVDSLEERVCASDTYPPTGS